MAMFRTLRLVFLLCFLGKECHSQLDVCGRAVLNTKIVGGEDASPGYWPWQVSLHTNGYHFCGGSLINSQWVLSAAHCFQSISASAVTVYLGTQTQQGTNSFQVIRSVTNVIVHESYNDFPENNDLALLQLNSAVTFNNYILPVCLASTGSTFFTGLLTWVTGWGNIGIGVSLPAPGTLQEVQVPIVGNRKCNCLYGVGNITDNMLCAGLLAGGKDSCQGDSGGPLVVKIDSTWVQAGIVSFGIGCAEANYPGVYTRLSNYQNWIKQKITSNSPGFVSYISNGTDSDLSVSCNGLPTVPTTTTTTTIPTTTVPPVVCGKAKLNTRMGAGSNLSSPGIWPWMASVQLNGTHVCGGTLVAEQFVMTSASCFSSVTANSNWTVVLGRLKQNGSNPYEVTVQVANISFSNGSANNIATIQLSSKPTLSDYIQPICVDLGSNSFPVNTQCWAAGWGSGGGVEQTLQDFSVQIVDCGSSSSANSICTGIIPLEQTDKGGPLMCRIGQSWIQAAVLTLDSTSSNSTSSSNTSTTTPSPSSSNTTISNSSLSSSNTSSSNTSTTTPSPSSSNTTINNSSPSSSNTTINNSSLSSSNTSSSNTSSTNVTSTKTELLPSAKASSMVFTKTSTFSTYLTRTVGSFPPQANSTSTTAAQTAGSGGTKSFSFFTTASVFLTSIMVLIMIQIFGEE